MRVVLFIIIGLVLFSFCHFDKQKIIPKSPNYSRDSTFIAYTIGEWIKIKSVKVSVNWFENNRFFSKDSTRPKPIVCIDTILHSADESKLYCLVIIEYDTSLVNMQQPYYRNYKGEKIFCERGIIGVKDEKTRLWKLYHYSPLIQAGFMDKQRMSLSTRKFFFTVYKDKEDRKRRNNTNTDFEYQKFGYNINDPDFWEKCWIWEKGLLIPGYYNFQLDPAGIQHKEKPLPEIPIQYPDSLLKLFK